ncbi:hypothetical protein MUP01_08910 [Candidatus Bathyarchaeota archaeon]|nr:hypothetical protein [Candidatus Bathyarchaeota archaeon]
MSEIERWSEAVDQCKAILEKFRPKHGRIRFLCGFEVEPEIHLDCNHADNPTEALEMAKREDDMELSILRVPPDETP